MQRWFDDAKTFERMRQNFTTTFLIEGPNMTLEQMSTHLCEMKREIDSLRALLAVNPPVCEFCGGTASRVIDTWAFCEDHDPESEEP